MLWMFSLFFLADSYKIPIYVGKISSLTNSVYKFDPNTFPICKKSGIQDENKKIESFAINFAGNKMNDIGLDFENMGNFEKKSICNRGLSKDNYMDMKTAISQNMYIQFIINGSFSTSVPIGNINHPNSLFYFTHWNFSIYYYGGKIVFAHASSSDPLPLSFDTDLRFTYSISSITINKNSLLHLKSDEEVGNWYHYYSLLKISVYMIAVIGVLGFLIIEKITNDVGDFQKDIQFDDFDDSQDQFHWRLLHGDIFRSPKNMNFLSSLVGTSFQLIFTFIIFIIINAFTSIVDGIGYFNLFFIIYLFTSFLSGYASTSVSVQFGDKNYFKISMNTVFVFAIPLLILIFLLAFFTNFSLFTMTNWISLVLIFILLILPLSLFGGYFGSTNYVVNCPCDVAAIPRKQAKLPYLLHNFILFPIIGSICSFLVIHEFNYMLETYSTGNKKWFLIFFSTVFFVSLLFVSAVSIVFVYILMKRECYWWQWRTFLAPFCSSFFLFAYLLNYMNNFSMFQNNSDFISAFLISISVSYLFGLIYGGIGFLSANVFIHLLFTNLKFS